MARDREDVPRRALGKPVVLLGAGASIDAGLSDTNKLTRQIYALLENDHDKTSAKVFGYIISRILSRKIREGASPFDPVNVEEAYDGVEKLVNRSKDLLFDFVSSWDPFLESLAPSFDGDRFVRLLERSVRLDSSRSFRGELSIRFDHFVVRQLAEEVAKCSGRSAFSGDVDVLARLIEALLTCLKHDNNRVGYMERLASYIDEDGGVVGSLNYDLVMESALARLNLTYDYGLSNWNDKKIVTFSGSHADIRLIKMHGSMNWFGNEDSISTSEPENKSYPLLIFGGANSKLRPDGPFLQLRHEFERRLLSTNLLIIIGYSFSDGHLNAIIRRWVSTRRRAKLIIVNPGAISYNMDALGTPYRTSREGQIEAKTVDIIHIKKTTSSSVQQIIDAARDPIDLAMPQRDGYLPHILINVVE